jgi:hypothetical protein
VRKGDPDKSSYKSDPGSASLPLTMENPPGVASYSQKGIFSLPASSQVGVASGHETQKQTFHDNVFGPGGITFALVCSPSSMF